MAGQISSTSGIVTKLTAAAKAQLAGLMRVGKVTTATSTVIFESTDLIGQDNDAFLGWYVSVLQADNAAPEGEMQPISDYVSATGRITHTTFGTQLDVGDWVVLLRPEIAMLGKVDTTAATGAVSTSKYLMAYVKQIVTDLILTLADTNELQTDWVDGGRLDNLLDAIPTTVLVATGVGVAQIKAATIDLNQAANTYDLFTGTAQAVILESLIIRLPNVDVSNDGTITSISIQTDDVTAGVIINSTDGAIANLTAEAQLGWSGQIYITVGTKIRLTIAGGAADAATVCNVTAKCRAVVAGGNLA